MKKMTMFEVDETLKVLEKIENFLIGEKRSTEKNRFIREELRAIRARILNLELLYNELYNQEKGEI